MWDFYVAPLVYCGDSQDLPGIATITKKRLKQWIGKNFCAHAFKSKGSIEWRNFVLVLKESYREKIAKGLERVFHVDVSLSICLSVFSWRDSPLFQVKSSSFFYISNCFFSHSTLDTISHHCFGHFVCMTVLVQLDVVSAYLYGCFFYINVIQIMRAREGLTVPILTPLFMMSPCLRFDQFATRMRPARQAVTIWN